MLFSQKRTFEKTQKIVRPRKANGSDIVIELEDETLFTHRAGHVANLTTPRTLNQTSPFEKSSNFKSSNRKTSQSPSSPAHIQ